MRKQLSQIKNKITEESTPYNRQQGRLKTVIFVILISIGSKYIHDQEILSGLCFVISGYLAKRIVEHIIKKQ